MARPVLAAFVLWTWLVAGLGDARADAPAPGWAEPPRPTGAWSTSGSAQRRSSASASSFESGALYVTSAAYGIGLGVWLDAEFELTDPALVLIPPTLLGVAFPITAYLLDRPALPRGLPGAVAAGLLVGAGEGLGLASVQMVTSEHPWGFTGMSRAAAIGSTLGALGGYSVGILQEPSPNISAFAASGVVWGSLIGSAIGLGASPEGIPFSRANDWMGRGGWIGFNAGLVATMALSTLFVPSIDQLTNMWLGGAIGGIVSLPVYLFYLGEGGPPAKRGLLFTGTATSLGIVAGGALGPRVGGLGLGAANSNFARVDYVTPFARRRSVGLQVGGTLF